jgi:hypothetical protein
LLLPIRGCFSPSAYATQGGSEQRAFVRSPGGNLVPCHPPSASKPAPALGTRRTLR